MQMHRSTIWVFLAGFIAAGVVGVAVLWLYTTLQPRSDYFGTFAPNDIEGKFVQKPDTRPHFVVANDTVFKDPNNVEWFVPKGTEVDGASIPQVLWSFAGPFEGNYLWASVVHDYYCDMKTKTARDTHRTFYYGMRARGVDKLQADFMYWAVAVFGPQWTNPPPADDGGTESGPAEDGAMVDLADPVMLAAAVAKAAAVARTLQTSDGALLDSSNAGLVANTLENIEQNAAAYRQLLVSGAYLERPADLGLLARWTEDINQGAFTGKVVPVASTATPLATLSTGQESGADAFVAGQSEATADPSSVGKLFLTLNPPAEETATVFGASSPATPVN